MIRLMLFISVLLFQASAQAQGTFMFSGRAPAPEVASEDDNDDDTIDAIYKLAARKPKPAAPRAVSPNERALRSPGRAVARGERGPPAEDIETESRPSCPSGNCSPQRRATQGRHIQVYGGRVMSTARNMATPIWAPFARSFEACAPGCQPVQIGIHREPNGRRSCHHSARAIDVGAMVCGGRIYRAIDNGRFGQMVSCMRSRLRTLYRQPHRRHLGASQAHYDHAHFSIGCYGGTFL
jgi:hypothetical protein